MKKFAVHIIVPDETMLAFQIALEQTGMTRQKIAADALTDWLVAHGYLDPYRKIAL